MKDCDHLLAIGGALLVCAITVSGSIAINPRAHHLTSDRIPRSMVPTRDLPLVDITTEKIPAGLTERGTSFYLGNDLWLSARHVVNDECARVIMIVTGKNVDAQIKYLDENADLAVLQAHVPSVRPLSIETAAVGEDEPGYAFGFPQGSLGATAALYLGRTRLKLGGFLSGNAPVLAWAETERYPLDLDSLAGISGGPMLDEKGNAIGIIVAASSRRGRNYTVAPEILLEAERQSAGGDSIPGQNPAHDIVVPPVVLAASARGMDESHRIVETYCIPR